VRIQKTALAIMVSIFVVIGLHAETFAAAAIYTCRVTSAGSATELNSISTYKVAISLTWVSGGTKPATTTQTFYAPAGHEKEFLAVALAAIVNAKNVSAMVDFTAPNSTVFNLSLLP